MGLVPVYSLGTDSGFSRLLRAHFEFITLHTFCGVAFYIIVVVIPFS
jgi:hypothetical protein